MDGKPIFLSEQFRKGILSINELLNETSNSRNSVINIPVNPIFYSTIKLLVSRCWSLAKCSDTINRSSFTQNDNIFFLNESTQINLYKAKSKDFYNLFNVNIHTEDQTGPKRWSEKLSLNKDVWTRIFKSLKNICKKLN